MILCATVPIADPDKDYVAVVQIRLWGASENERKWVALNAGNPFFSFKRHQEQRFFVNHPIGEAEYRVVVWDTEMNTLEHFMIDRELNHDVEKLPAGPETPFG